MEMVKSMSNTDEIYISIGVLIKNNCWKFLTEYFFTLRLRVWRTNIDMLRAYATASLPAKSKIVSRQLFMDTCKQLYPSEDWSGLE